MELYIVSGNMNTSFQNLDPAFSHYDTSGLETLELRLFSCSFCKKSFTQQRYQTRHELHQCLMNPQSMKMKERKFHTCSACGTSYTQRKSLNFHIRHDCNTIHKCEKCGATFMQYSSLKAHLNGNCSNVLY